MIHFITNCTELYNHISRKIVVFCSTAGGLIGTATADSKSVENFVRPTFGELTDMFFNILISEDAVRMFVGASIGGGVGGVIYILMWPIKRYMFRRWPINDARAIKEMKEDE